MFLVVRGFTYEALRMSIVLQIDQFSSLHAFLFISILHFGLSLGMLKKSLNLRLKYAKSMLVNVTLITYQIYENNFLLFF